MGIAQRVAASGLSVRDTYPLSLDEYINYFTFNGHTYPILNQTLAGPTEEIGQDFAGLVHGAYKSNGIVFACIVARLNLLSQARFQFQQLRGGRPGDLFGNADLELLERPEPGKVTGDLLARAVLDADLAGNHFMARRFVAGSLRLKRMRPDWVTIVMGSETDADIDYRDLDAEVLGYLYHPGGRHSGIAPTVLLRDQVAHFAPLPDPTAMHRGMSWLTPIIRDIQGDTAATSHKVKFFENGATVNLVVQTGIGDLEKFKEWVRLFREGHQGTANAFKTLFLTPGADATPVGSNFQEIDLKAVQGASETRIAAASGMHPVIVGLSEGLAGSSLNQGNFMAARRLVADKTLRPWWGNFASSSEVIIPPPAGSRLFYDDRHIPFLAEDVKDAAVVLKEQMLAIEAAIRAGYEADSVTDAVTSGDLKRLKHTGLFSVQLQPPQPEGPPAPPAGGNGQIPKEEADALVGQEG